MSDEQHLQGRLGGDCDVLGYAPGSTDAQRGLAFKLRSAEYEIRRATEELDRAGVEKYDDTPRNDSTDDSEGQEWSIQKRIKMLAAAVKAAEARAEKAEKALREARSGFALRREEQPAIFSTRPSSPMPDPVPREGEWTIAICPDCGVANPSRSGRLGACDHRLGEIVVVPRSRAEAAEARAEKAEKERDEALDVIAGLIRRRGRPDAFKLLRKHGRLDA